MPKKQFTPDDIRSVDVVTPIAPDSNAKKELEQITDPLAQLNTEKGWFGHIFGARSEKSGNVAGLIVIGGIALIGLAYFAAPKAAVGSMAVKDFVSAITSLITLALGYLFGRNSKLD